MVANRLLSLTPAGPAELLGIFPLQLAGPAVFSLNGLVDLLPMDWNFGRCLNSQTYFITSNVNNGNNDVVTNNDALVTLSREDKHGALVLGGGIVVGGGRVCRVYPWGVHAVFRSGCACAGTSYCSGWESLTTT